MLLVMHIGFQPAHGWMIDWLAGQYCCFGVDQAMALSGIMK